MNAALRNKKSSVNKTKLKKTIRNVICRPDPVFWPVTTENEAKTLEEMLVKYKINNSEFKKLHWKKLKLIPKDQRPKPPKIKKVEGLVFGISGCHVAVKNKQCTAVIIESEVNPRTIVQPLIEACSFAKVPVICLNNLRKISIANFGIATSALGIKCGCLPELSETVLGIAKIPPCTQQIPPQATNETTEAEYEVTEDTMDIENESSSPCLYLYRKNKKSRVFTPPTGEKLENVPKKITGQTFIKLSDNVNIVPTNSYMKMILKKISNNPNRKVVKQET